MNDDPGGGRPTAIEAAGLLIEEFQVELEGRIFRLQALADMEIRAAAGRGLLLPGGTPAQLAYQEARSAYVHGQFVAVVMLSQCLLENLLAGHVYMEALGREVRLGEPQKMGGRPDYRATLAACQEGGLLTEAEVEELRLLASRRNALAHFRDMEDASHVDRRALSERRRPGEIIEDDATLAIEILTRVLGKTAFRFSLG